VKDKEKRSRRRRRKSQRRTRKNKESFSFMFYKEVLGNTQFLTSHSGKKGIDWGLYEVFP
jgi:hypothetical protein